MLAEVNKLKTLAKNGQDKWTQEDRDLFKDMDGLREALKIVEKDLSSSRAELPVLRKEKATLAERLTMLKDSKLKLQDKLESRPLQEITTLQDFERFGIPLKKDTDRAFLARNVFLMTIDRDDVYEDLLRFFVTRESKFRAIMESKSSGRAELFGSDLRTVCFDICLLY